MLVSPLNTLKLFQRSLNFFVYVDRLLFVVVMSFVVSLLSLFHGVCFTACPPYVAD